MPEDDDLDDYELERTRRLEEEETGREPVYREREREREPYGVQPQREGIGFPMILAGLAVLVLLSLGVLFFVFQKPGKPQPTPAPIAPVAQAPAPTATPTVNLPKLDDSDDFVRSLAATLSANPELKRWLAQTGLVRRLTAVVDNVSTGETPRPHLDVLAPKQRFKAARKPGRTIVADPAGFAGYDVFADAIGSVDSNLAAAGHRTLGPLFEAAYVELGHPEGGFSKALDRSIGALLEVPVLPDDTELVPHAVGFRYADPKLEGLTAAQKQFLRLGPRNVRLIQAKLKELQAALASEHAASR
jgi:hypothetical protein